MELDKKIYNHKIVDCLLYFSPFIKDIEYDIDDTASNIRNSLNNNTITDIDIFLQSLKRNIIESMD
jgi:hypothetical protein